MEILQQLLKSRKWIVSTLLTIVNVSANVIDIHDSLYNLTGFDWILERPEYVDYFILIVAIIGLITNWRKAVDYEKRNSDLSD